MTIQTTRIPSQGPGLGHIPTSIITSFSFSNVANLTAGTGSDTFAFNAGGSISGSIAGWWRNRHAGLPGLRSARSRVNRPASTVRLQALVDCQWGYAGRHRPGSFKLASNLSRVALAANAATIISANSANAWSIDRCEFGQRQWVRFHEHG